MNEKVREVVRPATWILIGPDLSSKMNVDVDSICQEAQRLLDKIYREKKFVRCADCYNKDFKCMQEKSIRGCLNGAKNV